MKKKGLVLFLLSALLFTACGTEKNKTEETDKLTVVTSFYPVYLLAQEIVQGAEGIRLENMAQPQTGCLHDYELSISDMKLLETADIFIINGGGMESFLEQALERYPELTVVDTSEGIALLEEEEHHHHHHHHHHHDEEECECGHDHDHEHHHHHDDEECECGHGHEHHHHHHEDGEECECGHDHEHHHHHEDGEECCCGHDHDHHHHHHHGHDADEIFTSWGLETNRTIGKEKLETLLSDLAHSEKYGQVLRAKGMLPGEDGTWYYFDLVPEETEIRTGEPIYTGKVCVIGSNLKEDELKAAFEK